MNRANGLTRHSILSEIKRRGSVTTDELGQDLGISSVAVRQHLSTLAAEGKVTITIERRGLGRPVHRYHLTVEGDETFDRSYDRLCIELLEAAQDLWGAEGVDRLIDARQERLGATLSNRTEGLSLARTVSEIAQFQDSYGFMASAGEDSGDAVLTQLNCALCQVAKRFPGLCEHELHMFAEAVGSGVAVVREKYILAGDSACVYRFTGKTE